MSQRLDYKEASPEAFDALIHLERVIHKSGLEASLLDLVKCRSSQINGCAWCLDMHTKDARARGETEQRLYLLSAWRDAPGYTERERAALAWTEAVSYTHLDVYKRQEPRHQTGRYAFPAGTG